MRAFVQTPLAVPSSPLSQASLINLRAIAGGIPVLTETLRTSFAGPEPVGAPVEFLTVDERIPLEVYMLHCGASLLASLTQDLGLPAILACHLHPPAPNQISMAIWFDFGNHRLVVFPSLKLYGLTMSMQLAHSVWFHQGWMTGHDIRRDDHWADLSTNYTEYCNRPGYAYYEATTAKARNEFYWGFYRGYFDHILAALFGRWTHWGRGEVVFCGPDRASTPVFVSEKTNSFFHFEIGEPLCTAGSPPGIVLQRVRHFMAEQSQWWRHVYGVQPEPDHQEERRGGDRRIQERD
ncbi:MAG: hypothetical protein IPM33_02110 [Phycisphaerales bacterium]|nr:hypothetical protein [Phycisphaerales bacterium]